MYIQIKQMTTKTRCYINCMKALLEITRSWICADPSDILKWLYLTAFVTFKKSLEMAGDQYST